MSFRDESDDGKDIRKPFLHTGSWYRMGSRQSSMMGSSQVIRESSISVVACVMIVALGPIQFGFTVSNLFYFIFFPVKFPLPFSFLFGIFGIPFFFFFRIALYSYATMISSAKVFVITGVRCLRMESKKTKATKLKTGLLSFIT